MCLLREIAVKKHVNGIGAGPSLKHAISLLGIWYTPNREIQRLWHALLYNILTI
jgi:hypothetical protein